MKSGPLGLLILFCLIAALPLSCGETKNAVGYDKAQKTASDKYECANIDGYLKFIDKAKGSERPVTKEKLESQLREIMAERTSKAPIFPFTDESLRKEFVEILNIGFLIEDIDKKALTVTTIREEDKNDYFEKEIIFHDEYIGNFRCLFLTPKSEGLSPGIIALHGTSDNAESYRDHYHGADFPKHGYSILIPTFRAACGGEETDFIARLLLTKGFTLLGIRIYETLLMQKYLRYLGCVDSHGNIGMIGHSAGSSIGNVAARILSGVGAYVSDEFSDYGGVNGETKYISQSTTPGLFPYRAIIRNEKNNLTPVKKVIYGYKNNESGKSAMPEIFEFFDENLRKKSIAPNPADPAHE